MDAFRFPRHKMFAGRGRRGFRTARCLIFVQRCLRSTKLCVSGEVVKKHMTAAAKRVRGQALRSKLNS